MEEHPSEVVRLLRQIGDEYSAAQRGLSGLAVGISRHEFITARMIGMRHASEALIEQIGYESAMPLIVQELENKPSTRDDGCGGR